MPKRIVLHFQDDVTAFEGPVIPICVIDGIRHLLVNGMEPQMLADRLGGIIDAIVGDIEQNKKRKIGIG